jgi:hypothetical protein
MSAVCLYAGYNYAWPYLEQKMYEQLFYDIAKAVALQVLKSGMK